MNKLFQADLATVMKAYSNLADSLMLGFVNAPSKSKSFRIIRVATNSSYYARGFT